MYKLFFFFQNRTYVRAQHLSGPAFMWDMQYLFKTLSKIWLTLIIDQHTWIVWALKWSLNVQGTTVTTYPVTNKCLFIQPALHKLLFTTSCHYCWNSSFNFNFIKTNSQHPELHVNISNGTCMVRNFNKHGNITHVMRKRERQNKNNQNPPPPKKKTGRDPIYLPFNEFRVLLNMLMTKMLLPPDVGRSCSILWHWCVYFY